MPSGGNGVAMTRYVSIISPVVLSLLLRFRRRVSFHEVRFLCRAAQEPRGVLWAKGRSF